MVLRTTMCTGELDIYCKFYTEGTALGIILLNSLTMKICFELIILKAVWMFS